MINLIKTFAEVHDNDIRLTTVIENIGKVLDELEKLGFATEFASKPMLIKEQEITCFFIKV